jgi:hypothetical protein
MNKDTIGVMQLETLKIFLEMEIRTNLKMGKETALQATHRLTGMNFGRGIKGRENALAWVNQMLEGVSA